MKTASFTFFLFVLMLTGCKKDADIVKGFYDSLHFVRTGGGPIEFKIYSSDNPEKFNAVVTNYNSRDTTINIILDVNDDNRIVLSVLDQAMNNQIQINGDYQPSTLATGSFAFIYVVNDNKETEVTNTELRNSLLLVEQLVKAEIQ